MYAHLEPSCVFLACSYSISEAWPQGDVCTLYVYIYIYIYIYNSFTITSIITITAITIIIIIIIIVERETRDWSRLPRCRQKGVKKALKCMH